MSEKNSLGDYVTTYLGAKEALRKAVAQATAISLNKALPSDQQFQAGALAIDLDVQQLQLKLAHEAFMSTFTVISPPSQATVDRAVALAKALAAEVADNLLALGKLEAVVGIIGALNELASQPEGAAVQADAAAQAVLRAQQMERTTSHWLLAVSAQME